MNFTPVWLNIKVIENLFESLSEPLSPMKNSVTLLGLASAAIIFLTSRVEAVVINIGGTNYTITASSTTYAAAESALSSTPWFGHSALAAEAAGLVGTALGLPNSNPPFVDMGPVFAYGAALDPYGQTRVSSQALQGPVGGPYSVQGRDDTSTDTFFYATAAPEPAAASDFTYTATATEVTITGYTGAGGVVIIPASIGGVPVTSIGAAAFSTNYLGNQSIRSVTIPISVTSIGNYAFAFCSGLTSVTIPDSVTSIGLGAFSGCSSLSSVTIGSGVTSIGDGAFQDCAGLTSVTIPSSVTIIGNNTFQDCKGLSSMMIGSSVTSIGNNAFQGCKGLTSVTIPSSVTSIGSNAFRSCTGLSSVAIPDSVTSIGLGAFSGCSGLTSATIPASVTSIGDRAFFGCSALTRVMIPGPAALGFETFAPTTTVLRYLSEAQLAIRDSEQNAAGQTIGRALGQADVINAPNTHDLYRLSQVQALNVDAPLLTREAVSNKFKLTIKVKKSTDLKTFSAFPFVFENSTINANGEMEFQFTSSENAAFYRLEAR